MRREAPNSRPRERRALGSDARRLSRDTRGRVEARSRPDTQMHGTVTTTVSSARRGLTEAAQCEVEAA